MASCLSKLHSDPTFSVALFSPLGPLRLRSRPPDAHDSATLPATLGPAPRRLVLYRAFGACDDLVVIIISLSLHLVGTATLEFAMPQRIALNMFEPGHACYLSQYHI